MSEALFSTFRIGTAGLLVACGCPDELLDETWRHLVAQPIPQSHQEIVKQVRQAIAHVQARYGPPTAAEQVEARMERWAAKDAWRDPEEDET